MATENTGRLVWIESNGRIELVVWVPARLQARSPIPATILVSDLRLPVVTSMPSGRIVYQHPISLHREGREWTAQPVFAVLTGMRKDRFAGNRADIHALSMELRRSGGFLYVLPVTSVSNSSPWYGYVRVAPRRWLLVPCPRPQAIYNRIPFRAMERTPEAQAARQQIEKEQIPMFNPEYFNKAIIYRVVAQSPAAKYLPETDLVLERQRVERMLEAHGAVYLKPCGGSIGQGMIRLGAGDHGYTGSCIKNGKQTRTACQHWDDLWAFVQRNRLPGRYVIQAAKTLIQSDGRPCDFRVLLQKHAGSWKVVGRGVRVAGQGGITTHVPNGGSIADAQQVLHRAFGERAQAVDDELSLATRLCAQAIDAHYQGQLGEMSMDIGIDHSARIWFLEANSKPMKFDEPNIRRASLSGVVRRLTEISQGSRDALSVVR